MSFYVFDILIDKFEFPIKFFVFNNSRGRGKVFGITMNRDETKNGLMITSRMLFDIC